MALGLDERRRIGMAAATGRKINTGTRSTTNKPITTTQHGRVERPSSTGRVNQESTYPIDTEPEWLKYAPSMGGGGSAFSNSATDYYEDMLKEQRKAIQAQTDAAIKANNAYIPEINANSDRSLQDAYIAATQARFTAPQTLSALGYTGGATESTLMGLETGYQNNRNNIEKSRSNALSDVYQNAMKIRATGDTQIANASADYYARMAQEQADAVAQQRSDFLNSIGAYANDYQAQINNVSNDGDPSNDWQIAYLNAARNQKLSDQAASKKNDEQQAFENYLKQTQLLYNVNKPYFKPSTGTSGMSESEIISLYNSGLIDEQTAKALLGL